MTTVNDFVDILRIIREQPEWGDALRSALLSRELLEMPQTLAEFAMATNRRLATLEDDVAELKAGQARLEEAQARLEEAQARLEEGQARLEEGQTRLESSVARLEGSVARLEEGQTRLEGSVARLEEGQTRLESSVARLEAGYNRLDGTVGNLRGAAYEQKVASNIATIVRHPLSIRRVRLLKGHGAADPMAFHDLMDSAEDRGAISAQERVEASSADLVIQGERDLDQATVYVALEISVTAADSDIIRAADRSDLLRRATGTDSAAAIVSVNIDADRQRLAREKNVTLISFGE